MVNEAMAPFVAEYTSIDLVPVLACTLVVFTMEAPGFMCGAAAWAK